ncbi:MAG: hypothetical protein ACI9LM_001509 [Alteromonadaceae bacterium]|jgi:hypothetical protein
MKLIKNLSTAALLLSLSFGASAGKLFTVDEDPTDTFGGGSGDLIVADGISGNYTEEITINADSTFTSLIFATFNGLTLGGNDVDTAQIGNTVAASGYTLYATLTASGSVAANPFGASLTGFVGDLVLWMDVDSDTDYSFGSGTTNNSDDVKLGSSSNAQGMGLVSGSGVGFFDILFQEFALSDNGAAPFDGSDYFVAPSPFWTRATTIGTIQGLNLQAIPGTQTINGTLDIAFVPEPTSIAILGLALVGFGATSRKKRLNS